MERKSPSECADSEYECELMIEALRRELGIVRVSVLPKLAVIRLSS